MDRNKIRIGDKFKMAAIANFEGWRLLGVIGVIGCFVVIIGPAALSIASAKERNAYYFSG